MTTVSVAIATYNGARYLETQLLGIFGQVPAPAEIVLSDDASSDDTIAIAERVAERFPATALRILRNPTALGVTANFEQAVRACTGDVIALSDQDDRWHPGRLARLLQILESDPAVLVVGSDAALVDGDGTPLGIGLFEAIEVSPAELAGVNGPQPFRALVRRNLVTGATMIFRRSLLNAALPFPAAWLHDEWLAAIAAATARVRLLPEQLIDYRQHGANEVGATKLGLVAKFRRLGEPRDARNARLLARAAALVERLSVLPVDPAIRDAAAGRLLHEQQRSALAPSRARRVGPVLRALRAGDYRLYGRGTADALRDLLQPAR